MKLSAVLITRNEEKNIEMCLKSVLLADEVIVVDSGSSDRTPELARALAARVVSRPFDDFASQKNYAAGLAAGEWILSVDADERVGAALKNEILGVIGKEDAVDAYRIRRRTNFFGRDFKAGGLQEDAPARLFRRGRARFVNPVHEIGRAHV